MLFIRLACYLRKCTCQIQSAETKSQAVKQFDYIDALSLNHDMYKNPFNAEMSGVRKHFPDQLY